MTKAVKQVAQSLDDRALGGFGQQGQLRAVNFLRKIGKDGGERVLRTVGGPSCIAKNRYSLDAELPLDWNAILSGITNSSTLKETTDG